MSPALLPSGKCTSSPSPSPLCLVVTNRPELDHGDRHITFILYTSKFGVFEGVRHPAPRPWAVCAYICAYVCVYVRRALVRTSS